jgi:hypothetical protein
VNTVTLAQYIDVGIGSFRNQSKKRMALPVTFFSCSSFCVVFAIGMIAVAV